jgi:hypothetical protein
METHDPKDPTKTLRCSVCRRWYAPKSGGNGSLCPRDYARARRKSPNAGVVESLAGDGSLTETITFQGSAGQVKKLERLAKKRKTSRSSLLREAVEKLLQGAP